MKFIDLVDMFILGVAKRKDFISVAEQAVADGIKSDTLYLLAGETDDNYLEDFYEMFQQILVELNFKPPSKDQALHNRFMFLLRKIADGSMHPFEGAYLIEEQIYSEEIMKHPKEEYWGECLDVGLIFSAHRLYDELKDPEVEKAGRTTTVEESERYSQRLIIEEAKRILKDREGRNNAG